MFLFVLLKGVKALGTLWIILTISFLCLYQLPGDPARIILGPQASLESIAKFRQQAGLDLSLEQQYGRYILRTAKLDLGYSFALRRPVGDLILQRGVVSLKLLGVATLFVLVGGFLLPLLLRSTGGDRILSSYSLIAQTIAFLPSYVLATTSLLFLSGLLGWLPILFDPDQLRCWIFAAAMLSAYPIALLLRVFVVQLDVELATPYVRRARALGFSRPYILWNEVLLNALPAALAVLANSVAFFATSAFFIEVAFGVPGLGRLAQEGLRQKDIAVLGGICLTYSSLVLLLSLLLDFAQQSLPPRRILSNVE